MIAHTTTYTETIISALYTSTEKYKDYIQQ